MKKPTPENRELLFSVTKKDFIVEFMRGHGKGGQNKQKTSSACRITHPESGAVGYCQDNREQSRNRAQALKSVADHPKFKIWIQKKLMEIDMGKSIEKWADEQMHPKFLKVEIKDSETGEWKEWVDHDKSQNPL